MRVLRRMKAPGWILITLTLFPGLAFSQTPSFVPNKMDTVLYGVAYYTEYMPYERLEKDVQLMQQAGITVVRVGESSWGLWEPEDGKFEFLWMDRVVERMHQAGIRVILPRRSNQLAACPAIAAWRISKPVLFSCLYRERLWERKML